MKKKTIIGLSVTGGVVAALAIGLGVGIAINKHDTKVKITLDNESGKNYFMSHVVGTKAKIIDEHVWSFDTSDNDQIIAFKKAVPSVANENIGSLPKGDSNANLQDKNKAPGGTGLSILFNSLKGATTHGADEISLALGDVTATEKVTNGKIDEATAIKLIKGVLFHKGDDKKIDSPTTKIYDSKTKSFVDLTEANIDTFLK